MEKSRNSVNGHTRVLSVRLTEKQHKRLRKTLRNYGFTEGSPSDQLRNFLKLMYIRSVRYRERRMEILRLKERRKVSFG
jgi:hypothetical protein